ncbi:hypothetical protein [Parasitella parasitica]|uniref:DUF4536 domain-containing protein n=1 Tax=Parasitella parasitica TaxID=35722 RepID=A0A0B7MQY4_9FUNG|nr:hypothetical protein [Parasitella parasitica]
MDSNAHKPLPIKGASKIKKEDCLPCRLSGGAVGLSIGYFSLRKAMQLQKAGAGNPNKAVALGVTGVMFTSAGLYRLFLY